MRFSILVWAAHTSRWPQCRCKFALARAHRIIGSIRALSLEDKDRFNDWTGSVKMVTRIALPVTALPD